MSTGESVVGHEGKSSLGSVLPGDVSAVVFLRVASVYRRRGGDVSNTELRHLVRVTRLIQKLPPDQQEKLLSRSADQKQRDLGESSQPSTLSEAEQDAWIKEVTSDAFAWIRDLQKLGVASASSYIFRGRRSAPQPPKDWANEVLHYQFCEELTIQESILRYLDAADNVFVRLPDRRWYIKYHSEAIPPLADNLAGLRCIHALITDNHVGCIVVRKPGVGPECIFVPPGSALGETRQRRETSQRRERGELLYGGVKTFSAMRGNGTQDTTNPRRVADTRSDPERKQILRAIREIAHHNDRVAAVLNASISRDAAGVLSFKDSSGAAWVTEIPQLSPDASIERTGDGWVVRMPCTAEPVELPPDREKGMEHMARILQQTGVPVPVGLLADRRLLHDLTDHPAYQKLFKRTERRLVRVDRHEFDQGTEALIGAVGSATGRRLKYYEITHTIPRQSPLAKYIATGFVSLTPEGLSGVLYLLKKSLADATIDGVRPQELVSLVDDIERALRYVRRYEGLLAEVEPASRRDSDKVQKAVKSCIDWLWNRGEISLARHLEDHIKTGKLSSHSSPWLWRVQGLSSFPDVAELAMDHMYMKLRRLARSNHGLNSTKAAGSRPGQNLRH